MFDVLVNQKYPIKVVRLLIKHNLIFVLELLSVTVIKKISL